MEATKEKAHVLGTNHNNNMANQKGLDAIDLWAMGIGNAENQHHKMMPHKRHATTKIK